MSQKVTLLPFCRKILIVAHTYRKILMYAYFCCKNLIYALFKIRKLFACTNLLSSKFLFFCLWCPEVKVFNNVDLFLLWSPVKFLVQTMYESKILVLLLFLSYKIAGHYLRQGQSIFIISVLHISIYRDQQSRK